MARTPFYRAIIKETGQDITQYLTRLIYEDSIEEDDLVTFSFSGVPAQWVDEIDLNKGTEINFLFGYMLGKSSNKKMCVVKDINTTYEKTITLTVKALDKGFFLKKLTSNTVWEEKTATDIVKIIARRFGLGYKVDESETIYESLPQSNQSYFSFIKGLADKEGSDEGKKGSYEFYVKGNVLYFVQRDLSDDSAKTFVYGEGTEVKSFRPKVTQKKGESEETKASGIDLESKKEFSEKANVKKTEETGLGDNKVVYDINGEVIKEAVEDNSGKHVVPDAPKKDRAKKEVTAKQKDAELEEMEATLNIEGSPLVESGSMITVSGVAQKHAGNWYVRKSTHTLSKGGYTTELKLNKNAADKASTKEEQKVKDKNKTVGEQEPESKQEVETIQYDINGNVIEDESATVPTEKQVLKERGYRDF